VSDVFGGGSTVGIMGGYTRGPSVDLGVGLVLEGKFENRGVSGTCCLESLGIPPGGSSWIDDGGVRYVKFGGARSRFLIALEILGDSWAGDRGVGFAK
jgi:hypothetical protein